MGGSGGGQTVGQGMSFVWVSQAGCRDFVCVCVGGGGCLSVGQDMNVAWMSQAGYRDGGGGGEGGALCRSGHECCVGVTGRLSRWGGCGGGYLCLGQGMCIVCHRQAIKICVGGGGGCREVL